MYRDDLAATHARLDQLNRELHDAQHAQVSDKQRIAQLTAQLNATQAALQRLSGMAMPAYAQYQTVPRGSTILTLGILSLVLCSLMGPVAWSMGNEELRRIDAGAVDPATRGSASAGRICGMIASILMICGLVGFGLMMALAPRHW